MSEIPDIERIVSRYLREHPDIVELDARVVGKTPADTDRPWIRVMQIADVAVGNHRADHLIQFTVQLDCYAGKAGGQPEAAALNRRVRAALRDLPGVRDGGVVTGVSPGSATRLPDRDFEDDRERFVRTITVWAHP